MRGVPQKVEGEELDGNPQNCRSRQSRSQGEEEIGVKQPDDLKPDIGPDHVDLAVSEGHHAQRAEDQGETQGQQGIHASLGEAVDQLLEHNLIPAEIKE